jgi:GxxExxY protein
MTSNLLHSEITEKIIGCAMQVHSYFGLGFPEIIYKRSLILELEKAGLNCKSEFEKVIYYKNQFVGRRRLDLIVDDKILVELKAISEVEKNCYNQIINYLNIFDFEVGLLVNFGTESLQFKRFVNSSRKNKSAKS